MVSLFHLVKMTEHMSWLLNVGTELLIAVRKGCSPLSLLPQKPRDSLLGRLSLIPHPQLSLSSLIRDPAVSWIEERQGLHTMWFSCTLCVYLLHLVEATDQVSWCTFYSFFKLLTSWRRLSRAEELVRRSLCVNIVVSFSSRALSCSASSDSLWPRGT